MSGGVMVRAPMSEAYAELQDIPVIRVEADMEGQGPPATMILLESKLPTLEEQEFYGMTRSQPRTAGRLRTFLLRGERRHRREMLLSREAEEAGPIDFYYL
jgi:hypothetical protein